MLSLPKHLGIGVSKNPVVVEGNVSILCMGSSFARGQPTILCNI